MKRWLQIKGRTQTAAYWIAIPVAVYSVWNLYVGVSNIGWFALSVLSYMWCVLVITAGYHRLFAHRSYDCSFFWHVFFGLTGTAFFQGSPLSWAAVHHTHHKYADTDKDSHVTDWRFWVGRSYGPIVKNRKPFAHLMQSRFHMALHNYGLLVPLTVSAILGTFGVEALLYGYVLPLAMFFLVSNIHQSFSHYRGSPRNQPWLEFVFPTCGEWTHKAHHENPRSWQFGSVDLGAAFIRRIRHD